MGSSGITFSPSSSMTGEEAERAFQQADREIIARVEKQRNVFISFDMDDHSQVSLLRSQAKDDRFPFQFRDYSVKEPFDEKWKTQVRERISQTSSVIVAIGENTHKSDAVSWEIEEARKQGKYIIGVRLYSDKPHTLPKEIRDNNYPVIEWDAKLLQQQLEKGRHEART